MSQVEREYIKSVDDAILKASGDTLKKLQELDLKTQLRVNSFYDAYAVLHAKPKEQNIASTTPTKKNKVK
jgi:hypothetical protein